ncbi:hypothetical protein PCC7418_3581 [Halothece sp. PCC 7418]|uniref:DUF6930 domain-containing protein n=1 Tax=Halothece sp. (strain PCC 7418) TaxID=65093 RepID=UPI0002A06F8F|nr:hypothetical protein [Halothece sp. PCC 7418]AFZ45691.1 hypothetical protein PCC7418_3581 [Halothece sp. PCC 7418]
MATLHSTTIRRLLKLPQSNAVWEGDRRNLHPFHGEEEDAREHHKDCVIWVDSAEGMVRGMEMVSPQAGMEAVVRTLLRAMEVPQGYGKACRPQKVVVRDREIQFFLRGVLQELNIKIEYASDLPLIEALFQGLAETSDDRPPLLPEEYAQPLLKTAQEIWNNPPWDVLDDSEIITVEFPDWDIDPLYLSVMGMLGAEYGILLYRSFESLKTFRSQMFEGESMEDLETAFLQQDCWFLNYDLPEEAEDTDDLSNIQPEPHFGSVNPYEGLRPYFGEDEAAVVYVALKALQRFIQTNQSQLENEFEREIENHYQIQLPKTIKKPTSVAVTVATSPELETELIDLLELEEGEALNDLEELEFSSPIKEDLVPQDSFLSIGMMSWEMITEMRNNEKQLYQSLGVSEKGEGMPIILIQTSRPKAKEMIEHIQHSGGLHGIGFNTGEDPITDTLYDLGIVQTGNGELYLFGEFDEDDPTHLKARQQWEKRCQQTQGYCGLLIARGFKGASRGQPQLRDMMALFEAKALSPEELGLGVLQLME